MNLQDRIEISVVVPTYKRPLLLIRCINALAHQQNDAVYEIIVVSDGPDTATKEAMELMIKKTNCSMRYMSLPEKGGPAAARNLGWRNASGELIAFTDDDCIPSVDWLNEIWNSYQQNPSDKIAFTGQTIVPISAEPTDYEKNISQLESAEFITANCACSKQALVAVNGLDERFTMAWREDSDLQFRLMERAIPIIKVKRATVTHPVRQAPWGVSIREEKKGIFNALLYKKYPSWYKQKIQPSPPWHYYIILILLVMFFVTLLNGSTSLALYAFAGWFTITMWFAWKRLSTTSRSWRHVIEMIFTSAIIPVLSLYYRFYGAWKYKVLLLP